MPEISAKKNEPAKTSRVHEMLKVGLSSKNKAEKLFTIKAMGILRKPEFSDSLVDVLSSPDPEIVESVIETLGKLGNPNAIKYLLPYLFDEIPEIADVAFKALMCFNMRPVIPSVLKAASNDKPPTVRKRLLSLITGINDPKVAGAITDTLGQTQDPSILIEALSYFVKFPAPDKSTIFKMLAGSNNWEVAMYADLALSRIGDESARSKLKKLAKSPASPMRHSLVTGLNKAPMVQDREIFEILLRDPHPAIRMAALGGFDAFPASDRQPLILELLGREKDEAIRVALYDRAIKEKSVLFFSEFQKLLTLSNEASKDRGRHGIIEMGQMVVEKILNGFSKMTLEMKEQMLLVLGEIGDRKALPTLTTALSSKERWLKLNAISGIERMREKPFAARFVEMLNTETDPWIVATLISAISHLEGQPELESMKKFLSHQDGRVRANAVEAISKVKSPEVFSILEPLLRDGNDRVRVNASVFLWKLGNHSIIDKLSVMAKEPSKWVRASAAYALGEIGDHEPVPVLLELLNDREDVVYRNTIEALGKIKDARSIIPLLKEKENKRVAPEVFDLIFKSFSEN
ncbi:MAG: HEAT repeat domain-containing protein [Candidatus Riflebacteria bacterium]|nr:HEAT repeat domain-containing protein [Candidatus Riflebacteria bacterium]